MDEAPSGPPRPLRGRGAAHNPANRFEGMVYVPEDDEESSAPATQFLPDASKSIVARNDSPDVGFDASVNPYRGCEHGCSYCYARPTHEYLGFSAGLDFETRIMVKERAPELLRATLMSPRWQPEVLAMSGVTDCYQPVEKRLRLTRQCLEVLAEFRNPVRVVTKNRLVARDADVLAVLARFQAAAVHISITTLDVRLNRVMEPRTSLPAQRLAAIEALAAAGVPVGVLTAPVIPGLTDHEIPAILDAAARAGASFAGYTMLRLPLAVRPLFESWLENHFPERKEKVLNRLRDIRGGALNDPRFGARMRGEGAFADQVATLFHVAARRVGLAGREPTLSTQAFRRPDFGQMEMF